MKKTCQFYNLLFLLREHFVTLHNGGCKPGGLHQGGALLWCRNNERDRYDGFNAQYAAKTIIL